VPAHLNGELNSAEKNMLQLGLAMSEEGPPSPYEPFPRYNYLAILFEVLDAERIVWIEKSVT
jgi:hypothetical protein